MGELSQCDPPATLGADVSIFFCCRCSVTYLWLPIVILSCRFCGDSADDGESCAMASDRPSRDTEGIRLGRPHPWRRVVGPTGRGFKSVQRQWQDSRLTCKFAIGEIGSPHSACVRRTHKPFRREDDPDAEFDPSQQHLHFSRVCCSSVGKAVPGGRRNELLVLTLPRCRKALPRCQVQAGIAGSSERARQGRLGWARHLNH